MFTVSTETIPTMAATKSPYSPYLRDSLPAFSQRSDSATHHHRQDPILGNLCCCSLRHFRRLICIFPYRSKLCVLFAMFFAMVVVLMLSGRFEQSEYTVGEPPVHNDVRIADTTSNTAGTRTNRTLGTKERQQSISNQTSLSTPQWMSNITLAISHFAETYRNLYPGGNKFFSEVRKLVRKKWEANETNLQTFRTEIRAALGDAGKPEELYLTKRNTPRHARMFYYMAGRPANITDSLWKTLPQECVFQPGRFRNCSVVGSSGVLTGSKCGKKIDQADFVFRFNVAPVKGFEQDVGTTTNFTSLNPSFIDRKLNSIRHKDNVTRFVEILRQFKGSYLYLPGFAFSAKRQLLVKAAGVAEQTKVVHPVYGSPNHFMAVSNLWRKTLKIGRRWPSTGIYVISSLFDMCDRVNIYGFWPFPKSVKGKAVPYHYNNNVNGTRMHNFGSEFKALMYLHEKGILQLHIGNCV